jgi:hypothetical protein
MIQLATLIHHCTPEFNAQFGSRLQPLHRRALDAMLACKSQCGQCLMACDHCQQQKWIGLSCGHRACPQCQVNVGELWFARQQQKLLPAVYFMVTFTLPAELRKLMWRYQSFLYDVLFKASVDTLKTIAKNNHGLKIGMTGVLHTHTRALDYHPHVHFIVPGGGMVTDQQGTRWQAFKGQYFVNEMALGKVFKGIFLRLLADTGLEIPAFLPKQWVANIKCVGRGEKALRYLSRYLYRGVISQNKLHRVEGHQVRYDYQDSKTKKTCSKIQSEAAFLWRLIQHILPRGFRRVRDFGFLHPNAKKQLQQVQALLKVKIRCHTPTKKPPLCACCKQPVKVVLVVAKKIPLLYRAATAHSQKTAAPELSPS